MLLREETPKEDQDLKIVLIKSHVVDQQGDKKNFGSAWKGNVILSPSISNYHTLNPRDLINLYKGYFQKT